jgi:hypothetical protein
MPTLPNYTQFDGLYWDTGVIRNALDYQGAKAPHTGEPYTEAMLLGISGGVTFGYFTFHYEGYDPQVNLLTRNTFEPMETILDRLAIPREIKQTTSAEKARQNLIEALEAGSAPIVWADMFLLPYNVLKFDEMNWGVMPVIVYSYDPATGEAAVADRSYVGLKVSTEVLDKARARVKQDKHRLMTLEHPDNTRLPDAVRDGIQDCIALMTEKPPRGSTKNFGLSGLRHWAEMLEKDKTGSWSRDYPTGRPLLSVLISSFYFLGPAFGKTIAAERDTYAAFLEEAAAVLQKPELENVAARYRMAGKAWSGLLYSLLPEDVSMLKLARELIEQKHELFMELGGEAIDQRWKLEQQLDDLKKQSETDFPLNESEIAELRAEIRWHVLNVHDAEQEAVKALKAAME